MEDQGLLSQREQVGPSFYSLDGNHCANLKVDPPLSLQGELQVHPLFKTKDFLCGNLGFLHHLSAELNSLRACGEHAACMSPSQGLWDGGSRTRERPGPCPGVACDLVGLTNSYLSQLFLIWLQPQGS